MSKLDILVKQINKNYKEDIASRGIPERHFQKIPFSSPRANYMTYGGIPRGRIIEFAGEENGGKTTTALDIVANAQKLFEKEYNEELDELDRLICAGSVRKEQTTRYDYLKERGIKKVVYCDCENTLDDEWATKLGVNTQDMLLLKPMSQSAEEIFEMLLQMIETDEVGLVIIDSLGVMLSQQAYDKDVTEKTYGGIAAALTLFSKKAEMLCTKYDCTIIGINQLREDMSGFGQMVTTGGKAWKHNCSLRLAFKKGDFIDEVGNTIKRSSDAPAGNLVNIAIMKTKVCRPDRRNGFYTLSYTNGVDQIADTVDLAVLYGIIVKGGSWYAIIDKETGEVMQQKIYENRDGSTNPELIEEQDLKFQGKSSLLEFLRNEEEIYNLIYDKVMKKLEE